MCPVNGTEKCVIPAAVAWWLSTNTPPILTSILAAEPRSASTNTFSCETIAAGDIIFAPGTALLVPASEPEELGFGRW